MGRRKKKKKLAEKRVPLWKRVVILVHGVVFTGLGAVGFWAVSPGLKSFGFWWFLLLMIFGGYCILIAVLAGRKSVNSTVESILNAASNQAADSMMDNLFR